MNREDRAKQFAPFEALKGLRDALREKEIERERIKKKDLSDEKSAEIQKNLFKIGKGSQVILKYYENGAYREIEGVVDKKDIVFMYLLINGEKISFEDLYHLELKNF